MSTAHEKWLAAMHEARRAMDEPMERPDIARGLVLVEWAREWRLGAQAAVPGDSARPRRAKPNGRASTPGRMAGVTPEPAPNYGEDF